MSIRKADETKAVSRMLVMQKGSSEEVASKVIDFHWQVAQVIERHEQQKRQKLLERMRNLTISEKHMFLLGMIIDQLSLSPIWPKLFDELRDKFED